MDPTAVSLIVATCIFVAAMAGLLGHARLPEPLLTKETQDVVRLATGMLSVLASLVLGLLIATAKTQYDTTDQAIRSYAAELILLDETFRDYGPDAAAPRNLLRDYTRQLRSDSLARCGRCWRGDGQQRLQPPCWNTSARRSGPCARSMTARNGCRTRHCRSARGCCGTAG